MTRTRARDLGIAPGELPPGENNAITDVDGVTVGQVTVDDNELVHTGVTAIRPHPGNLFREKVFGGVFVGNGFAKMAGSVQVAELGTIETPVILTNTLSVAAGLDGAVGWTIDQPGNEDVLSVSALVGETNDGVLNDIRGRHVTEAHVRAAIDSASSGPVEEGSVGAGRGTVCFGWKGGIGTSSRVTADGYTVGVLIQTNYGGSLRIDGVPIALDAGTHDDAGDGSCMIVTATDAPLSPRDLERVAARTVFAMARTGSSFSHGSGDCAIAFSTHRSPDKEQLPSSATSPLFTAALDATEEAIYNSLFMATTVGDKRAIPLDDVVGLLRRHGRL